MLSAKVVPIPTTAEFEVSIEVIPVSNSSIEDIILDIQFEFH
jgi:hypothetical protein